MSPILAKIRALRELARNNTNPHEAANAAAAAEKLCQEHRISEATLDAGGPASGPTSAELDAFARIEPWRSYLLTHLCKHHGCAVAALHTKGRGYEVVGYGTPEDLAVVKELYAWLTEEIERLAEAGPPSPRWRKSFKIGASEGIRDAIDEAHARTMRSAPSTALAVLDARRSAAHEALREKHGKPKIKRSRAPRVDEDAFEHGHEAGRGLTEARERQKRGALK